jgi:hypothetical protein
MAYNPETSRFKARIGTYGNAVEAGEKRILVYASSGAGKTQFAASAPAPLFLDCDLGENKYLADHHIPRLTYKGDENIYETITADLRAAIAAQDIFDADGGPYADRKTLVLDSWTKLNELLLSQACKANSIDQAVDRPGFDEYRMLQCRQQIIMKYLKQLSLARGFTIIVTALPMLEGSEDEKLKRDDKDANKKFGFDKIVGVPNMIGKYRYAIGAEFTDVYYMEVVPAAHPIRRIWTQPHAGYFAKSRLGMPPSIDLPDNGSGFEAVMAYLAKAPQ